jgi:hypothetical protein
MTIYSTMAITSGSHGELMCFRTVVSSLLRVFDLLVAPTALLIVSHL